MSMKNFIVWLLCTGMLLCGGCMEKKEAYYEKSDLVMDTVVTLQARGDHAKEAVEEGFARLKEIEAFASNTIETSDVSRINAAAGGEAVIICPELMHILQVSQSYSQKTEGAWDITVGPLINLWGIGTENQHVPAPEEIQKARALVDYKKLELHEEKGTARLQEKGMSIDLGGIAKGYAADEVRKVYQKYGIENGLINLGASSMYAVGVNGKNKPWAVGIKHPRKEDNSIYLGIVHLKEESLSTSGDYERFFIADGKRYHHILDPATGYPADSGVMSDTIIVDGTIADGGMLADLLTTAVFVMGPEKAKRFLNQETEAAGELTLKNGEIIQSAAFQGRLQDLYKDFHFSAE